MNPHKLKPTDRKYRRKFYGLTFLLVFTGILIVHLFIPGCEKRQNERCNVVLILVDTLRADSLGCYGNKRQLTPVMDRLAQDGIKFDACFSASPWTLPSVASIYTSRIPSAHRAGKNDGTFKFSALPDEALTLAESYQKEGYFTGAVVNVDFLSAAFGLDQGFESMDFFGSMTNQISRSASETTDAALTMIRNTHPHPFFILVHYFDPHLTYNPPAEYRERFAEPEDKTGVDFVFGTRTQMINLRNGSIELNDKLIRRLKALYDGEVAYTDHEIGRLIDGLDALNALPNTMIFLTSDHGEEFNDHGGFEHGHTLYQELLHVPLIARFPSHWPSGKTIPQTVRSLDIAPTIAEAAGIPIPETFSGRSLLPLITEDDQTESWLPVFSEGNFWGPVIYAWRSGNFKLIFFPSENRTELYNVSEDPLEHNDLAPEEKERCDAMLQDIRTVIAPYSALEQSGTPNNVVLTEEQKLRLQALGYLQ